MGTKPYIQHHNTIQNPYIKKHQNNNQNKWQNYYQKSVEQQQQRRLQSVRETPERLIKNDEEPDVRFVDTTRIIGDQYEPSHDFTIFHHNINGLQTSTEDISIWKSEQQHYQKVKVDVQSIAEKNCEWGNTRFRNKIAKVLSSIQRHTKLVTATTSTKFSNIYKPGGTCTIVRGRFAGSVESTLHDSKSLGRWSGVRLHRQCPQRLSIISAYRPSQRTLKQSGTETAYFQQYSILESKFKYNDPDPRQVMIDDLTTFIQQLKKR